jgi:site-specific DNA recombinase
MKVAAYVRVSTQRQSQTQTITQQMALIEAHCQTQGWELPLENIFQDDGYSGANFKRPGLERLRDGAQQARFERILITAPDRLARNFVHQALLLEELQNHGCAVEFLDRPMSQDPHDQLLLQIRGAVAEYERTLIAERMRRGRLAKLQAGMLLPYTKAPYGYQLDPDRPRDPRTIRINQAEAAVVKELYARYLDDQVSLRDLARSLHSRGIKSPTGQDWWHLGSLRNVLTNPIYIGEVHANRTRMQETQKRLSALRPVGKQQFTSRPTSPENWILVARVEAIVTPEEFAQVQEKLRHNQNFASRNNTARDYLLRSLVSCGHCLLACTARGGSSTHSYYVCKGKSDPIESRRPESCRARMIPAAELDQLVWNDLLDLLQHPEMIIQALDQARDGAWLPQQLQARRSQLMRGQTSVQNQLERLTTAYLSGVIPIEEYQRRRADLESQAQALNNQFADLNLQSQQQAQLAGYAAGIKEFSQRVAETLAQATFEQKRQLVELLIDRVIVKDDQVEIRYVIPTGPAGEKMRFCHLRSDYCNCMYGNNHGEHGEHGEKNVKSYCHA